MYWRIRSTVSGESGCGAGGGFCFGFGTSRTGLTGMSPRTTARRRIPCSSISDCRTVCDGTRLRVSWSRKSSTSRDVNARSS